MANPARPALIINADDLGYSPGVNMAIANLYQAGLVTSTSLIVNLPHSEAGAAIAFAHAVFPRVVGRDG